MSGASGSVLILVSATDVFLARILAVCLPRDI